MLTRLKQLLNLAPQIVWVCTYGNKHGTDVSVFTSAEAAERYRQEVADDWWELELPTDRIKPDDPAEAADEYFEFMEGYETFTISEAEVRS